MARHEEGGSNPFWWVVLGFICGVVATLGALMVYGGGREDEPSGAEVSSPADDGGGARERHRSAPSPEAETGAASSGPAASADPIGDLIAAQPTDEPAARPETAPPEAPRPAPQRPVRPPASADGQIADDAAASGMTTRSPRN